MGQVKLGKNYIYNSAYELLLLMIPFITTPYVSRILGAEIIGRVSFSQSISSYFVLFSAVGTSSYARREIAVVRDDKRKLSAVFWSVVLIRFIGVILSLFIYLTFTMGCMEHKLIYLCCSLDIISVLFDVSWFFQGLELYDKITKINGISKILGVLCIFAFVHTKSDVICYIIFLSGFSLLGNIFLWTLIKDTVFWKVNRSQLRLKKHFIASLRLLLPQISIQVYTVLDKTMLGVITKSEVENGYYEQAQKICRAMITLVIAPGSAVIPRVAYLWGNDFKEKINTLIQRNFRLMFAMAFPIITGVLIIADMFVDIYFGAGYEKVAFLMRILIFIIFAAGCSGILGNQYLVPTKREKIYSYSVMISAGVNLVLNLFLIKWYGSGGAVIASVAAEMCCTLFQAVYLRKEIDYKILFRWGMKYLVLSIVMGAVILLLKSVISGNGVLKLIAVFLIGFCVYLLELLVTKDAILKKNFWNGI